jgi:hypothetical protein
VLRRPVDPALTAGIGMVHELHVGAVAALGERHPQRV